MPTRLRTILLSLIATLSITPAQAQKQPDWVGTWRNGSNSVHIRTEPCGRNLCGRVVWANAKAKADARRGGTAQLIGTRIFRDFKRDGAEWRGKVFVPDIGKTFSGTLTQPDRNTLRGSGCLLGHIACKEQTWKRVR